MYISTILLGLTVSMLGLPTHSYPIAEQRHSLVPVGTLQVCIPPPPPLPPEYLNNSKPADSGPARKDVGQKGFVRDPTDFSDGGGKILLAAPHPADPPQQIPRRKNPGPVPNEVLIPAGGTPQGITPETPIGSGLGSNKYYDHSDTNADEIEEVADPLENRPQSIEESPNTQSPEPYKELGRSELTYPDNGVISETTQEGSGE